MNRIFLIVLSIFACFILYGCGDNAATLFDTAKFEELQNNRQHAVELYERIVSEYPESSYAERAKARLAELKAIK
ncbi:MAG: outer membrane protein assembly factor BamD [Dissulfurispiraceae bacterium]|jgi:outer membrane protein assembly factor BamD (BamD/ComL family)|nr:outer membrane protein assembly factor BamD [Dissulfurispiraceae bacterium]